MNLDFGILWIEDSFSPEEEANLKRCVLDAGFTARIETIPNSDSLLELAGKHALYHLYDMILLDYRLKNENGDELAPTIRKLFPSTTILFYSGSAQESDLRQLIAAKQVEGVYCCRRDHQRFIQRAGELISQTARAMDRLSGMRGLAMRVVAECDEIMKNAMLSMCEQDNVCASKVSELDKDVLTFMDEIKAKYEATLVDIDLARRLETRAVDSVKLFKHFRRLTQIITKNPQNFGLKGDQVERLRELRRKSSQYDKLVLTKRNILGHVFEVQENTGWVLRGSDEIEVKDFPEIRRNFAEHIEVIREIGGLVA